MSPPSGRSDNTRDTAWAALDLDSFTNIECNISPGNDGPVLSADYSSTHLPPSLDIDAAIWNTFGLEHHTHAFTANETCEGGSDQPSTSTSKLPRTPLSLSPRTVEQNINTLYHPATPIPSSPWNINPRSATPAPRLCSDENALGQRLSHLHAQLVLPVRIVGDTNVEQLEKAAAHVLAHTTEFLDLFEAPELSRADTDGLDSLTAADLRCRHWKGGQENCFEETLALNTLSQNGPWDTATVLQVVVLAMRLQDLHYKLYAAIYDHLRGIASASSGSSGGSKRNLDSGGGGGGGGGGAFPAPITSLSIAGVALVPPPRLQLLLLLQTAVHYLGCIQRSLEGISTCVPLNTPAQVNVGGSSSSGHMDEAVLVRMLVAQDQQRRMVRVRAMLERLREDFNMPINIEEDML